MKLFFIGDLCCHVLSVRAALSVIVIIQFFQRIHPSPYDGTVNSGKTLLPVSLLVSFSKFSPSVKGTGEGEGKINKDWLRGSSISRKVNRWIGKGKKRKEKVRIAGAFR